jgi:4-amino-4-deoxy-L-arabinose transferase-like glycosyltransferase
MRNYLITILLVFISFTFCFYKLGESDLVRWDEYTNYRVVADTIKSGNFFVLKYEDSQTGNFFEKPPLWYWLTELVVRVGGMNNFNLRLVTAVSGVGVLLSIFYLGKKLTGTGGGLVAWAVALLTPHFFISFNDGIFSTHTFRSADLDALQLLFILLTLISFVNFNNQKRIRNIILASIFTALAYLTKGPFAFLPGVLFFGYTGIAYLFKQKDYQFKEITKLLGIYIAINLLIAGLWVGWMSYLFGWQFIDEYFIYHNLKRVATPLEGHGGDWTTFIKYLFNKQLFLFAEVLLISLVFLIYKYQFKLLHNFKLFFPVSGVLLVFIFLTITQTKIAWYLFYLYPFACLIIAMAFSDFIKHKWNVFLK